MDDWDFDIFKKDLIKAVMKVHNDKCSKVVTHIDFENKEYVVTIEQIQDNKKT